METGEYIQFLRGLIQGLLLITLYDTIKLTIYVAKKMYSREYNCYEVSYWARPAPCYSNEMAGDASKEAKPECGKYLDV